MALDDFNSNKSSSDDKFDLSALEDNQSETERLEQRARDGYCPNCGNQGENTPHWYWRCTTSTCDVTTFIPV